MIAVIQRVPAVTLPPLVTVAASLGVGYALVERPSLVRVIAAVLVLVALLALATVRASTAVVVTLTLLPFLALGRRMLLDFQSWQATDPLLLVAPLIAIFLIGKLWLVEWRPLAPDRLSKLVLALFAITVLQSFNPNGGSVVAGVTALLFAAAPLLWFFVGRDLLDRAAVRRLLALTVPVGAVVALYGLMQSTHGLPSWDAKWLPRAAAYNALVVGDRLRSFGTFSSSAEYTTFLALALTTSVACALRRRVYVLAAMPLLASALFLGSSRTIVVLTFAAAVVILGASTGNGKLAAVVAIVVSAAAFAFVHSQGAELATRAAATDNALITHQVGGLVDPLDPQQSTMLLHLQGIVDGFKFGLSHPLGHGIASTTLAGGKFGGNVRNVEVDTADAFVALGLPGGLVFLAIVLVSLRRATSYALRSRSLVSLGILGVLVVTLGQWSNGGYYAVSALVWVLLGVLARETAPAEEASG